VRCGQLLSHLLRNADAGVAMRTREMAVLLLLKLRSDHRQVNSQKTRADGTDGLLEGFDGSSVG
jgi:hypothetical protein